MKRVRELMVPALIAAALPGLAVAGDLNCPAGTVQIGGKSSPLEADACALKDGKLHGPYVVYHPNGMKQAEGLWDNGFRTGTWTYFDTAGVKTGVTQFQRDNFHGERLTFHPNGRVALSEQYVKGSREGLVKTFDKSGEVVQVTEFKNNRLVLQR